MHPKSDLKTEPTLRAMHEAVKPRLPPAHLQTTQCQRPRGLHRAVPPAIFPRATLLKLIRVPSAGPEPVRKMDEIFTARPPSHREWAKEGAPPLDLVRVP